MPNLFNKFQIDINESLKQRKDYPKNCLLIITWLDRKYYLFDNMGIL